VRAAGQIDLQRGLGNIKADVEDRRIVLTHTCNNTSPGDQRSPCSSNGSSLGQKARAKQAPKTPHATRRRQGRDVSTRTVIWEEDPSSANKDVLKIQGRAYPRAVVRFPRFGGQSAGGAHVGVLV
jgi:hypothetical protein